MKARWAVPTLRDAALIATLMWLFVAAGAAQAQNFARSVFAQGISGAFDVALFDMDGDRDMDAAATSMWGSAYLIETLDSSRETTLLWASVSGLVRGLAAGDLDGDGDADVVVAAYGDDRFVFLENTGQGGPNRFVERTLLDSANGAWSAETGDFDADDDLDLVVAEYRGNSVKILENQGGQFSIAGAAHVREPFGAVFADYDADGDSDVVCCSLVDPLAWIEQGAGGEWTLHFLGFGTGTTNILARDLDGDGDRDLIGAQFTTGNIVWWERISSGFAEHVLSGNLGNPRGLGVADFSGDGRLDVVAGGQYGDIRWWRNEGGVSFTGEWLADGLSLYGLDIGDVDQDGDPDVVVADYLGSELLLYRNLMVIPAILQGTVQATATGAPLADIEVTVDELGARTFTDAQGRFELWTAEGDYTLSARHACWNTELLTNVHLAQTETTTVAFSLERGIVNLDVTSLNLVAPNREPTYASIPLSNDGDGALDVHAQAFGNYPNDTWLTVSPADTSIPPGGEFTFDVTIEPDTSDNGLWDYFGHIEFRAHACPDSLTNVAVLVTVLDAPTPAAILPVKTTLGAAYPNPFNSATVIPLELAREAFVTMDLFDVNGRYIRSLLQGTLEAGIHSLPLSADALGSGVYFVRMRAGEEQFAQKLLLVR